jgi:hypothetical protein
VWMNPRAGKRTTYNFFPFAAETAGPGDLASACRFRVARQPYKVGGAR